MLTHWEQAESRTQHWQPDNQLSKYSGILLSCYFFFLSCKNQQENVNKHLKKQQKIYLQNDFPKNKMFVQNIEKHN